MFEMASRQHGGEGYIERILAHDMRLATGELRQCAELYARLKKLRPSENRDIAMLELELRIDASRENAKHIERAYENVTR